MSDGPDLDVPGFRMFSVPRRRRPDMQRLGLADCDTIVTTLVQFCYSPLLQALFLCYSVLFVLLRFPVSVLHGGGFSMSYGPDFLCARFLLFSVLRRRRPDMQQSA